MMPVMNAADTARLVALAAIWGASFIFLRVVAGGALIITGTVLITRR